MRTVIVHYHLFKNAGTTVDRVLSRNFPGEQHGHIEGPYPWSTVEPEKVLDFAIANPALRVISSHQARLPLPQHAAITFLPILFIRHPIDRFASVYEFERRNPADSASPSVAIARNGGLVDFANWVVGRDATAVCRNFHVIHLAGAQSDMRTARATHHDYELALSRLKSLPFFGIVDSFQDSLDRLQAILRPDMDEIDLTFVSENVTPGRHETLGERLRHIEQQLGEPLYRELLECNALDLLLYEEAQRMFREAREHAISADSLSATEKSFLHRLMRAFARRTRSSTQDVST